MTMKPSKTWDRRWRFGAALRGLWVVLAAWAVMPREVGAQSALDGKAQPPAAKGSNAEVPKAARQPLEYETVKLDNGTEVPVEKWGKTYPAHEYRPPLDILDRRVHVVLDSERDGVPQAPVTGLEVDSKGGRLYWTEGLGRASAIGSVRRARLDGRGVQTLAADRVFPNSLVLDKVRGRIYWLEGAGEAPCRLQAATLDGKKETTLSRGLNRPEGLALDSMRGHLYYWEQFRLVRVNVDGTGEHVVTSNRRLVMPRIGPLSFDSVRGRLIFATVASYGWLDRDAAHLEIVPRMRYWANIHGSTFDEEHQKVYFAELQTLRRANLDCSQLETLVTSPAECDDGWIRRAFGDIALDPARRHLYWSGHRMRAAAIYPTISRTGLPPLAKPSERTAPPQIVAVEPYEQGAGGEVVLAGEGLAKAVEVSFIDDSTGAHASARFHGAGDGRLAVTVPRLGEQCCRPVIVVRTPSGVTMTLGTNVLAPDHGAEPYEDTRTVALDKDPWWIGTNRPYKHERSVAGSGARVWLRPGLVAGNMEAAVVYAVHGSCLAFGPKGMVTVFAKDDSYVADLVFDQPEVIVYHEPFAVFLVDSYYNRTVKRIPVPAIRPSFPERAFRYRAN